MIPNTEFAGRRQRLFNMMDAGSVLIVFSGVGKVSSADETYPFEVNRNFYYLTGIDQEDSVLMAICYDTEEIPAKPLRIYFEFADIYDELRDVFNRIAADLASGTSIDDIYLLGADESYQDLLERFSSYYGFQVETTASAKLYDSALYHSFRADYLEKGPAILSDFLAKHPGDKNAEALYKLFARFSDLPHDEKTLKSFFDERLKHETQDAPHYERVVRQLHDYIPPKNAHGCDQRTGSAFLCRLDPGGRENHSRRTRRAEFGGGANRCDEHPENPLFQRPRWK